MIVSWQRQAQTRTDALAHIQIQLRDGVDTKPVHTKKYFKDSSRRARVHLSFWGSGRGHPHYCSYGSTVILLITPCQHSTNWVQRLRRSTETLSIIALFPYVAGVDHRPRCTGQSGSLSTHDVVSFLARYSFEPVRPPNSDKGT